MLLQDTSPLLSDKVILLKGNNSKYSYSKNSNSESDYVVKCPLIRFGDMKNDAPNFKLEFNTLRKPDNVMHITNRQIINANAPNVDGALRHMINRWTMMTVVVSDHKRYDGQYDGVQVTFFLNDAVYASRAYVGDALRWNNGDLVFFPDADNAAANLKNVWLADVYYANYALDALDVKNRFKSGFNKKLATSFIDENITAPDNLGLTPMMLTGGFNERR
jgi:hypothetical protein